MATNWIDAVVTDRTMTTPRVVVLDLEPIDGNPFPEHEAGAHIDVLLSPLGSDTPLVRQYSLCGEPGNRKRYRIAVLRDERSRGGSVAVHGLEVGDHVRISAPRNVFRLAPARRHLLFAGGIGITPLAAMAQQLDAVGGEYTLHYSARSAADVALSELFPDHPRLVLHLDDQPDEQRLDLRRDLGDPVEDTAVYVCGPGPFMDHVLDGARAMGWPATALHKERFAPSAAADAPPGDRDGFIVRLASSGAEFHVPPEESVLDVLLRNGVDAPSSCQQGICGECVVRVLAGEPDHRDDVLTDSERAEGMFTTCSSRALSPRLELDL